GLPTVDCLPTADRKPGTRFAPRPHQPLVCMRHELMPERPGASSPAPASDAAFGARLRMERERRRITLASIAANTKINLHLLEGLERGQVTRWPSGIFRRSFIRAYAEAIGLDQDEITREFLARFPDAGDLPFEGPTPETRRTPGNDAVLRLNLADLDSSSSRGTLLFNMGPRWAA